MKRYAYLLFLILSVLSARAQEATVLDWGAMRIDSLLPYYTEVVPLESDYRLFDYRVQVDYPEWMPATAKESKMLERFADEIGEELQIETFVGVSRRQGMLDIRFCPVVRRGGKFLKLHSGIISILPQAKRNVMKAPTKAPARAANSVLSQGKWVKIAITEDGIYRLTRAALKKMGFSNPDNVHLYGYGGHRLPEVMKEGAYYDDLQEVPLYRWGETWLFWGNGLVHWEGNTRVLNHYARQACYFLTETGTPNQTHAEAAANVAPQQSFNSFTDHVLYEQDEFAWFSCGRHLYEGVDFSGSGTRSYKLSTVASLGDEKLTIAFSAGSDTPTQLSPSVNGHALPTMSMKALSQYYYATTATGTFDVSRYGAEPSKWDVKLSCTSGHAAHLDYLALHYKRALVTDKGFVAFSQTTATPTEFVIVGNVEVMRLPEPGQPGALLSVTRRDSHTRVVVPDGTRRFVAFDTSYNFPEPTVIGAVDNQNLHAWDHIDMLIIVPASGKLVAEATRLAEAHAAHNGLRVGVARADQIYNEFSSGTPDATAYRLFCKHLYDKAADRGEEGLRYLLLMGDCAWDNRMLSSAWSSDNPDDYLLCFESEDSWSDTKSYVMEDYFGLLDEGEGANLTDDKVDLGVGRFPVTTPVQARVMVDKSIDFLTNRNAGNWKNIVCCLGDDGDENSHLIYADSVARRVERVNPEMEVRKVMWDAYNRVSTLTSNTYPEVTRLIEHQMQEGALVMNYTGHGATYCLSHEFVLKLDHFRQFKSPRLPLWVTAACDVMPFDSKTQNIGEEAMLNNGGAAVAFYGTARTVYATNNLHMNLWFMQYLFATDSQGRRNAVGDAIRLAKNHLITGDASTRYQPIESYNKENKLQYALLGDPALVFGAPTNRVVLDSINGQPLADIGQLRGGERVRLSGHVEDAAGGKLQGFRGVVTARLYDSRETITCKNNAAVSKPFTFSQHDKVLFNGQDSVRAGEFVLNFVMPYDILFSDETGRVVFYAIDDTKLVEANGYSEEFTIGGMVDNDDTQGPDIYLYLDEEDFPNGGLVGRTPLLVAQLHDESGISCSGAGLGHDLLLTIDDDPSTTYVLNNEYQTTFGDFTRGEVSYLLPELAAGKHKMKFRAWDVLNNTSQAELDFVVDEGYSCIAEVFDFTGRCLWRAESAVSHAQLNRPRLKPGVYIYRRTTHYSEAKDKKTERKIVIR